LLLPPWGKAGEGGKRSKGKAGKGGKRSKGKAGEGGKTSNADRKWKRLNY